MSYSQLDKLQHKKQSWHDQKERTVWLLWFSLRPNSNRESSWCRWNSYSLFGPNPAGKLEQNVVEVCPSWISPKESEIDKEKLQTETILK